jgi:subtilisin family serine protease
MLRPNRWLASVVGALLVSCAGPNEPQESLESLETVSQAVDRFNDARGTTPLHVLVELTERPTALEFHQVLTDSASFPTSDDATTAATEAAVSQLNWIRSEQDAFSKRLAAAPVANTREVYRLQRVFNGIVYATNDEGMARLRTMPGVRSVYVMPIHVPDNAYEVPFVGAQQLWSAGVPLTGRNMKVGIIDTGVDYTHSTFRGAGTAAAYTANNPNLVESGSFPTAKVVGGYDFAGASYNAAAFATSYPIPDNDPLDVNGHGTHVAGTAAGYGVNADGTTYTGTYNASLNTSQMRIGPGAAPEASIYALKVFGDDGSTALSALAVEWATDPNGDGNFSDRLDVVNLSLGSAFGSPVDPSAIFYTNAVNAGVVVVASAGNSSDIYFATGAPGATPSVVSVAASTVGFYSGAVRVNTPMAIAGTKPAGTPGTNPDGGATFGATNFNLTGDIGLANPPEACPQVDGGPGIANPADLVGKIAVISRGTCSFTPKAYEAQRAGAIGVIIVNNVNGDPPAMAAAPITVPGPADGGVAQVTIPVRSISLFDGTAIRAVVADGGTVNVTMDSTTNVQDSTRGDTIASFSSRGPVRLLGQAMLKPDVTAPGFNVVSASVGTGNGPVSLSGTSMAAPLTAGVMALVRQSRPNWTPQELKALVMNTAGRDLFDQPTPPRRRISPTRVGAGRIDAVAATQSNVIAFDKAAPDRVSVSFTALDVAANATENKTLTLKNKGTAPVTYNVTVESVVAPPGVTVAASSNTVTVSPDAGVDFGISLTANPSAMSRLPDETVALTTTTPLGALPRNWLSEASGYVVFTPAMGSTGPALRVPYFGAPIPASNLTATTPFAPAGTTGTGNLTVTGTGIDTRSVTAAPRGVVSLSTPFELAYASPRAGTFGGPLPMGYPEAENDIANLKYVGVTSNLADGRTLANGTVYFAINTWAIWGTPTNVEFQILMRKAGATQWEFLAFNRDPARLATPPSNSDNNYVFVRNLATGSLATGAQPINGVSAAQFFVPAFYADTMVLPVSLATLGLSAGSSSIEYQVRAISNLYGLIDQSPILSYDPAAPAFSSQVDTAVLPAGSMPVRLGAPGSIAITYNLARARATQTGGILLINHHNAAGSRAQAVAVTGLTCTTNAECAGSTPVCDTLTGACVGCASNFDCARGFCDVYGTRTCKAADCRTPGGPICPANFSCSAELGICEPNQALISVLTIPPNTTCPAGGLQVNTGFDNDRDGNLDRSEFTSTNYICNGTSQVITAEPAGANCATGGARVQGQGVTADGGSPAPIFICNGAKGDSARVTQEPAGMNCSTGGVRIEVGMGGTATYVCNGASAAVTPEAAGMNCATGGLAIRVGSGMPAYVCNGQNATVTNEAAGANCATGGVKVQVAMEAATYVCNGAAGPQGPAGPMGATGATGPAGPPGPSSCSTVDASALTMLALGVLSLRRRRTMK